MYIRSRLMVINLGQTKSDNINWMITTTGDFFSNLKEMGCLKCDHIKRLSLYFCKFFNFFLFYSWWILNGAKIISYSFSKLVISELVWLHIRPYGFCVTLSFPFLEIKCCFCCHVLLHCHTLNANLLNALVKNQPMLLLNNGLLRGFCTECVTDLD